MIIRKLYLIEASSGITIYYHSFEDDDESIVDPSLFSAGVSAMAKVIDEASSISNNTSSFYQIRGNSCIIHEGKECIIVAFVDNYDEYTSEVIKVLIQFYESTKEQEEDRYREIVIEQILKILIKVDTLFIRTPHTGINTDINVLSEIDIGRMFTISDILDETGMNESFVFDIISNALYDGSVVPGIRGEIKREPSKSLVNVPIWEGDIGNIKMEHYNVLKLCDGTRTLQDISKYLGLSYATALQYVSKYKGRGIEFVYKQL